MKKLTLLFFLMLTFASCKKSDDYSSVTPTKELLSQYSSDATYTGVVEGEYTVLAPSIEFEADSDLGWFYLRYICGEIPFVYCIVEKSIFISCDDIDACKYITGEWKITSVTDLKMTLVRDLGSGNVVTINLFAND